MPLKGDAAFRWDPGTGVVTFNLNYPLRHVTPSEVGSRWTRWSLNNKSFETVKLSSSDVREISAVVRFESDPDGFLTMLRAAADGDELQYYPSLASPGTYYPCYLVSPAGSQLALEWDQARGVRQEYELEIRLRRIDGGNFNGLIQ